MTITEKIAYIKGLMEGMQIDTTKPENKLISAIVDALGDIAETVTMLDEEVVTLNDYADELDSDLGDVEEYLFGDDECDCCDCDDDDDCDCCDCCCDLAEIECPNCGDTIYLDDSIDPSDVICPNCQKHFNAEAACEDEE